MNIYTQYKRKILFIFLLIITATIFVAIPFGVQNSVSAVQENVLMHDVSLEYKDLDQPQEIYYDAESGIYAIKEKDKKLLLYVKNAYQTIAEEKFTSLGQIAKFDKDNLLISDNGSIYKYNVSTSVKTAITKNGENIGSDFDYNGKYMITNNEGNVIVYSISGTEATVVSAFNSKYKSPIAINGNDDIFYLDENSYLCKSDIKNKTISKITEISATKIIANDTFVYYIENSKIFRLNVSTEEKTDITPESSLFELGNLSQPTDLYFKGENVLISDSTLNAVQEFAINENKLVFTGFAIANGKSAYNRISKTATDIESFNGKVAVLDQQKLTVITMDENFDGYNPVSFNNLFVGENTPTLFALGKNTIIAKNDNGIAGINLSDNQITEITIDTENPVKDITYQSGKYYLLTKNLSPDEHSTVFVINENDFSFSHTKEYARTLGNIMTVDVFGNVYIADETTIYKNNENNGALSTNVKLATDLIGKLYAFEYPFAMGFERKEIYYLDGSGVIKYYTDKDNLDITAVIPEALSVSGEKVDSIIEKYYTVKDGANAYALKPIDGRYVFDTLTEKEDAYALIQEITLSDDVKFLALAGSKEIVIVNLVDIAEIKDVEKSSAPEKAFLTTSVHAYYIPIITDKNTYVLTNETPVKLNKDTKIYPINVIDFLDCKFYYAYITEDKTVSSYIPVCFTTETLYNDISLIAFSIEQVKETPVYSDKEMTEEIEVLTENQAVRLYGEENGTAYIGYEKDGAMLFGYVPKSAVKNVPNTAIRNILIIVAVVTCLCGSTSYFLLRKKS